MKLIDQWNELENLWNQKEQDFIEEFFKDKEKPSKIYFINGWRGGIVEANVTGFYTPSHKPGLYGKIRPTKLDVAGFKEELQKFKPNEVVVSYEYTDSAKWKCKSGVKFSELNTDHYFTEREPVEPVLQSMIEKYAPRENHFACTYCKMQTPNEKKVTSTIIGRTRKQVWNSWKNRYDSKAVLTNEKLDFCSAHCASSEQMSREG